MMAFLDDKSSLKGGRRSSNHSCFVERFLNEIGEQTSENKVWLKTDLSRNEFIEESNLNH